MCVRDIVRDIVRKRTLGVGRGRRGVGEMGRRHDNKEEEDKLGWNSFARDAAGLFHLPLPEKLSG